MEYIKIWRGLSPEAEVSRWTPVAKTWGQVSLLFTYQSVDSTHTPDLRECPSRTVYIGLHHDRNEVEYRFKIFTYLHFPNVMLFNNFLEIFSLCSMSL